MMELDLESEIEKHSIKSKECTLHHFCTRLWERFGIAGTPEVLRGIKKRLKPKNYIRTNSKGNSIYHINYMGRKMRVYLNGKSELYTIIRLR